MFDLESFHLESKTIFLRVDYNVPIEKGKIIDDFKIRVSLPTIHFLLKKKCKIIIATHLGRPEGKVISALSVAPLYQKLKKLLPKMKITYIHDCIGREVKEKIEKGLAKEIFFLENLRFYKEEEENDPLFAQSLASLADMYINDAFGVYRKHASVEAITRHLPSIPGFLMEKEITALHQALNPPRPSIWILGGGKFSKIKLMEQALERADTVLIGGALAFPFLRAQGIDVGMSKIDSQAIFLAKKILKKKNAKKFIFPIDFAVGEKLSTKTKKEVALFNQIPNNKMGLDIGPKTIELFKKHLQRARTVVWNGPLGCFELAPFSNGTKEIGRYLSKLTAITICGGGETQEALQKFHLQHDLTHVSSGGGAAVAYLSGEKLPSIKALEENYKRFHFKVLM